ncbi:MAG: LCP family glycopolymer transferase, partial [Blastococcus sp.]
MPGTREIKGQEALSYVRVRYTVGDGTDTMRIHRQQA